VDNKSIIKELRATSNLMELHDENEFKVRSYRNAIYNIERTADPLENLDLSELEKVNGIGKSIAAKIHDLNTIGKLEVYDDLVKITPPGILEMMSIKGLGLKKIKTMWQILGITNIQELQEAIDAEKVKNLKGFGSKIQEKFGEVIQYYLSNKTKLHFSKAEKIANALIKQLTAKSFIISAEVTGEIRRKTEVVSIISIIIKTMDKSSCIGLLKKIEDLEINDESGPFRIQGILNASQTPFEIFISHPDDFERDLMISTGSVKHLAHKNGDFRLIQKVIPSKGITEKEIYKSFGYQNIVPELREDFIEWQPLNDELIELDMLKGILHNHTTYSDGRHSLAEMVEYCHSLGYEYLGISDHSKAAAFYANGLDEDRVKAQQDEIDKIQEIYSDFKIFKGIEADILPNGDIDFEVETLSSFDFVVASIHSVLNMDIVKATDRVIKAVNNPFTTILGHMTGRQLLIREGYPLDHKAVIDACADNNVIIEVNAHPNRLDIDWRWIPYALEKGVIISINPDAHEKTGYHDMYYGVAVARKGGLTKKNTFNTRSKEEVTMYFNDRNTRIAERLKAS